MKITHLHKKAIGYFLKTLCCLVLAPVILHSSFDNTDKSLFYPVLSVGLCLFFLAFYFLFKALQTLANILFKKGNQQKS